MRSVAFTFTGRLETPSWLRSRTRSPLASPHPPRHVGVHPHLVLLHHLGEQRVGLRAAEGVHGRAAEEQAEAAGGGGAGGV